jgi:hypothetical protein
MHISVIDNYVVDMSKTIANRTKVHMCYVQVSVCISGYVQATNVSVCVRTLPVNPEGI